MLYEDRKKEIETIKERTLVLKLSDADCDRILQKAASHGMTVSELLESFIGDLVDGTFTNGSDERYLAEDWFNRCGFERDDKRTLLWHLLEQNADLENFIELYEENEEYKSHPEEFEEQREEYEMEPGDTFDFEDELQYWLDDWKPSKLSMANPLGLDAVEDKLQLALDLTDVRLMLEPSIASLAAQNRTDEEVEQLAEYCDAVREKIEACRRCLRGSRCPCGA